MLFDEIRDEILNSLNLWDFSPAFPVAYAGSKSVLLVPGWPMDIIDRMLSETAGQMTRPVISVLGGDLSTDERSLGGVSTLGGVKTTAERVTAPFAISCWADTLMGGADTVVAMAGQIAGWVLLNRQSLTAYRQLKLTKSSEAYQASQQVWEFDVTITGYALLTYS